MQHMVLLLSTKAHGGQSVHSLSGVLADDDGGKNNFEIKFGILTDTRLLLYLQIRRVLKTTGHSALVLSVLACQ